MPTSAVISIDLAERLAGLLMANVDQALPYHMVQTLMDDERPRPAREVTPVFCGAFDWHSAVHSHWALVRLRWTVAPATRARINAVLDRRVTRDGVAAEVGFLTRRPGFELPYGLAWVLALCAELRGQAQMGAGPWSSALGELEALARERLVAWLGRIPVPIRGGEHSQSAFAASLTLDWARVVGDGAAEATLIDAAERLHGADRDAPIGWEPSAHDFLSPVLGVAALMARVRAPEDFATWLDGFAPALGRGATFAPVRAIDRADGKLVHWDGLNLSRAWMLDEIAAALPTADPRAPALGDLARAHGDAGVAALDDMTYAGAHWLPSFAVYWLV